MRFGRREAFAIELGAVVSGDATNGLRVVQLWAAGLELCVDDDHVFVPQFARSLEASASEVRSSRGRELPWPELSPEENHERVRADDALRERYWFMHWGPTTDNVSASLFTAGDEAILTFGFWREEHPRPEQLERLFVACLPLQELADVLSQAARALRDGLA